MVSLSADMKMLNVLLKRSPKHLKIDLKDLFRTRGEEVGVLSFLIQLFPILGLEKPTFSAEGPFYVLSVPMGMGGHRFRTLS